MKKLIGAWKELPLLFKWTIGLLLLMLVPMVMFVINRAFLPFDLDTSPYYLMSVIERVRQGGHVHVPTDVGQAPVVYTPMYFWVSGLLCRLLGSSMVWPRLVNVFASFGFAWLVGALVWKRTERNLFYAVAAPAMLLATYTFGTIWIVEIQVNPLHLFFAMIAFYLLAEKPTWPRVIGSAVAISFSALTKQTGVAYIAAIGVFLLISDWRKALGYGAVVFVVGGGIFWLVNHATQNEMLFRILTAGEAPWVPKRLWEEVLFPDLLGRFGLMIAVLLVPFLLCESFRDFWRRAIRIEYVMLGAGVLVALIAQPKHGSGRVQAIMAYAALLSCGMIGLWFLQQQMPEKFGRRLVSLVVLGEMVVLMIPAVTGQKALMADDFDWRLQDSIGSVFKSGLTCFYPYGYIPTVYGQPDTGPLGDELMWKDGKLDYSLKPDKLSKPFRDQYYDYVIMAGFSTREDPIVQAIVENYDAVDRLPTHPNGPAGGNMRFGHYVFRAKRLGKQSVFQPNP